jgi:hypothetical protein
VFTFDARRNEIDTLKFAEAITLSDGTYDIGALPPQDYFLGVNAEKYHDRIAYPPTYYGSTTRNETKRITLREAERIDGMDLVLGRPRKKVTLIIDVRYDDGTPVTATGIPKSASDPHPQVTTSLSASIEDINEVQRDLADQPGPVLDGKLRASVWADEVYTVKAHLMESGPMIVNPDGSVRGNFKFWEGRGGQIRITEPETTLRVVIVEKPLGAK